ncbi:MAG: hypothetical protein ACRBK7_04215 [Acidimicrobiales bacterium]
MGRGPADPTEIGQPPNNPPNQGRPLDRRTGTGPGLPPLTQPTGELPIVQATASPGDTVVVTGPMDGVFAERPTDAVGRLIQPTAPAGQPQAADEPFAIADQAPSAMPSAMPSAVSESGVAAVNNTPPTALPPAEIDLRDSGVEAAGDAFSSDALDPVTLDPAVLDPAAHATVGDDTTVVNAVFGGPASENNDADDTAPGVRSAASTAGDGSGLGAAGVAAAAGGLGLVGATVADDAPTNPFPEAGLVFDRPDSDQLAAAPRDNYDPFANVGDGLNEGRTMTEASNPAPAKMAAAASAAASADMRPSAKAAAAATRPAGNRGERPLNAPPADLAAGNPSGRQPRRAAAGAASAERLQDTEFKLADKRRKQKPKEPNRLVLALAMGLVVLVGIGVAWFLTRGDGAETGEVAVEESQEAELAPEGATTESTVESLVEPEPQVDEPTLFLDDAQLGPLQQSTAYGIDLVGEPAGSMLQVVVDDIPQGEPDPQLPDLILPAGRHTLHINMINGDVVAASTPVNVYVLGDPPPLGFRANLSSVDFQTEGWQEAIRQFDEFRAAGHEGLQLYPISDGYWNIFVGGLGEDRDAAEAYCESFSLEVPDQCFPTYFEGVAGSAETTATTAATETEATTEDGESMTDAADDDTTSTTAAGG